MTSPDDDQIRSLLRDASTSSSMPADVAARLDDVLAGLRDSAPAEVIPFRARRSTRLLSAAAAVALVAGVGVGLQQVLDGSGADSDDGVASAQTDAGIAESAPEPTVASDGKALNEAYGSFDRSSGELRSTAKSDLRLYSRLLVDGQVSPLSALVAGQSTDTAERDEDVQDTTAGKTRSFLLKIARVSCPNPPLAQQPGSVATVVLLSDVAHLLVVGPDRGEDVHLVGLWSCATGERVTRELLDLS